MKRPAKNIYPTRKHDHVRPPSKVSYSLTVTDNSLYQGNTLDSRHWARADDVRDHAKLAQRT